MMCIAEGESEVGKNDGIEDMSCPLRLRMWRGEGSGYTTWDDD